MDPELLKQAAEFAKAHSEAAVEDAKKQFQVTHHTPPSWLVYLRQWLGVPIAMLILGVAYYVKVSADSMENAGKLMTEQHTKWADKLSKMENTIEALEKSAVKPTDLDSLKKDVKDLQDGREQLQREWTNFLISNPYRRPVRND